MDGQPVFVTDNGFGMIQTCEDEPRKVLIRPDVEGTFITLEGNDHDEILATFTVAKDAEAAYDAVIKTATTLGDVITVLKLKEIGRL